MIIYKDLCPACGTKLTVVECHKVAICRKCGKRFEGEEVSGENLAVLADDLRKKGSYEKASKMYSAILDKEPDNFRGLNGVMLCENKLRDLSEISMALKKGTLEIAGTDFARLKRKCKTEDKEYFNTAEKLFSMAADYIDLSQKLDAKSDEVSKKRFSLIEKNEEQETLGYTRSPYRIIFRFFFGSHPIVSVITTASAFCVTAGMTFSFFMAVFGRYGVSKEALMLACKASMYLLVCDVCFLGILIIRLRTLLRISKLRKSLEEDSKEKYAMSKELERIRTEMNKLNWIVNKYNVKYN